MHQGSGSVIPPRPPRSGRDRRNGDDRRRQERRGEALAVALDRREGRDRRHLIRRAGIERRKSWERRRAGDHGTISRDLSERDRQRARRLADDFAAASGLPAQRIAKVVRSAWPTYPLPARAGLAEALLPIFEPLAGGKPVSEELRKQTEEVVASWMASL